MSILKKSQFWQKYQIWQKYQFWQKYQHASHPPPHPIWWFRWTRFAVPKSNLNICLGFRNVLLSECCERNNHILGGSDETGESRETGETGDSCESGESDDFGESDESSESVESGDSVDSGDSDESSESGKKRNAHILCCI